MVCFWEYLLWTRRVDFCIYSIWLMCKRCWVLIFFFFFLIGKRNYIQKIARCKRALALRKYKNERKQKEKTKKH